MSDIRLEKRGKRIQLITADVLPGLKTAVPGAYQSVNGSWTVPLSIESCKLLREKYGRRLHIGTELARWARGVKDHRASMADLAAASDAELHVLHAAAPKLAEAMERRTYQRVAARFIADNVATLLADDPGLGKTLEIMGGIVEAQVPGPYLIIAPKTAARDVWQREIQRWLPPEHRVVTLPETRLAREKVLRTKRFGPLTWLIVHPEILMTQTFISCGQPDCKVLTQQRKKRAGALKCGHPKTRKSVKIDQHSYPHLFKIEWGAVVVDESHESLIVRTAITQRRNGMEKLRIRPDGIRIAASGTPMNNKPHQLWGTLNWLSPKVYSAFNRWAELYWAKGGYTGYEIGEFRAEREPMLWDSLNGIALRRTKLEVAKDLPPKMEIGTKLHPEDESSPTGIWLPMEGEQERAYEQMVKHSAAELASGRLEAISALAELTRLKQLACSYGDIEQRTVAVECECHRKGWHREFRYKFIPRLPSNKFQWLIENLEEWGYPRNPLTKVVVVSMYTGLLGVVAAEIEKHFKTKKLFPLCTSITGKVSAAERSKRLRRFNEEGHEQIMFLNVKAGGTAITIDSADRMVFLSETRIPDQQLQAEDRIHRVSNPRQCMYYYLRSLGTVDVGTALVNQELIAGAHRLLDGRRGVEYLRKVMELSN